MERPTHWYDLLTINISWFGLTAVAQTMTSLLVPLLVQRFVGEAFQGTYYGTIRLWSLMTALLVQSFMGIASDRSSISIGKRRPFILAGTLVSLIFMAAIGFSSNLAGMDGYTILFILLILLASATNTSQAALQGLITDLVPVFLRGRFSGVKALFEIPLPMVFVALAVAPLVAEGRIWSGLLVVMGILLVTLLVTMFVPEPRQEPSLQKINWQSFIRLIVMTVFFTGIILLSGYFVRTIVTSQASMRSLPVFYAAVLSTGILGMVIPIIAGVWISIRISLGNDFHGNAGFMWWVVSRLAFIIGATNLGSFAIYFLQGKFGYLREQAAGPAGKLLMFVGIFILITALPAGWLADRFGGKQLVFISGLSAMSGTGVVLLSSSLFQVYIGGALVGLAAGLFYSSSWALGTSLVPPEQAGRFLGISNLAGAGAGAIGAFIGGPLADTVTAVVPQNAGLGYTLLFSIYGILFLFSAVASLLISNPSRRFLHPQLFKVG